MAHGSSLVPGATEQTDDGSQQHESKLREVHHPQSRKEGEERNKEEEIKTVFVFYKYREIV